MVWLRKSFEQYGFVIIRQFFSRSIVEQARSQLDPWFDKDEGTLRYPYMDLHLAVPGKAPALDAMFEDILSTNWTRQLLENVSGSKELKFKDINARRSKPIWDNGLKWHTDGIDEYGIGIPLTDVPWFGPATGFKTGVAWCNAGDFYLFKNRALHCRMRNWRKATSVVVLGSFFPKDKPFTAGHVPWPKDAVHKDLQQFRSLLAI